MCCEAITAPIYAPLADRLGRRPVFLSCLFFWGIFAVCFGFVRSVGMTIVVRGCCESQAIRAEGSVLTGLSGSARRLRCTLENDDRGDVR